MTHLKSPGVRAVDWRRSIATIAILLASAQSATSAATNEQAMAMCRNELVANQGAEDVHDLVVKYPNEQRFVFGSADFADVKGIHFRCRVFKEAVHDLSYLVNDAEIAKGRAWTHERPQGEEHEGLELDDAAISTPATEVPSPHFIRVKD